jgi:S1-C subfamily serine protease
VEHEQTVDMNAVSEFDLSGYSAALSKLIDETGRSVVAIQAAAYRVTSGVAIAGNLIAANDHAVRREGKIPVHLPGGERVEATILGRDPTLDLAILGLEQDALTPVTPEEDSEMRPGALAIVTGRTIDSGLSASAGILGAVGPARRSWRGGALDRFLRLDVNLYPSQAGAGVFSANTRFWGMATAALLRHSTLAVPFATLNRVAQELLREGRIRHGYLGVGLQPIPLPERLRSKSPAAGEIGLMVISVESDSPAEKAGIHLGDILLAADEKPLREVDDLQAILRGESIGSAVGFTILRAGSPVVTEILVAERAQRRQ